jgi:tRNA-splicing ligase RtcB (3'-phosphate/5'-hydroxy nucleic acid ligase)
MISTMSKYTFVDKTDATSKLITDNGKVITVIGNDYIRDTFEDGCLEQASNIANAPGVIETVISPDSHSGYGAGIGTIFTTKDRIYLNACGPDVKCSMSFLQTNVSSDDFKDVKLRESYINSFSQRASWGIGNKILPKALKIDLETLKNVVIFGANKDNLEKLNIPVEWIDKCEDSNHGDPEKLSKRLNYLISNAPVIISKLSQLGGIASGNHMHELVKVSINPEYKSIADSFGLIDNHVGALNHFGSRGFGYLLTSGGKNWPGQFKLLADKFDKWNIPFPGNNKHNVYCPIDTPEFDDYMDDMNLASNFATVNHLLVCKYIHDSLTEVLGNSVKSDLVYYIAHNIIRKEIVDNEPVFVHRKGATRAYPAKHFSLRETPFYDTGHPILIPGNVIDGSTIMVAKDSRKSLYSVNHGAGRAMSRKQAKKSFTQNDVNNDMKNADIVSNCNNYPIDESQKSYKDYKQVIDSVEKANLAFTVATLKTIVNIKDNDNSPEDSA